jgi:alanine transaminase
VILVLKNTGIVLVPGSGFGQKPDTYHFRTTILILPEEKIERKFKQFKNYNNLFH